MLRSLKLDARGWNGIEQLFWLGCFADGHCWWQLLEATGLALCRQPSGDIRVRLAWFVCLAMSCHVLPCLV